MANAKLMLQEFLNASRRGVSPMYAVDEKQLALVGVPSQFYSDYCAMQRHYKVFLF